jgi:hypothetical protein
MITVWQIFSLLLSSNCKSLYQVSLKKPNAVAFSDDFGLLQPYADDDCREAVYTLCLPVDVCVHCFTFYDKTRISIQSTFQKTG